MPTSGRALRAERYSLAALVFLNDARCTNHRVQGATLRDLRLNARLLQLPRANLDRRVVVLFALKDGDIFHPHWILFWGRRCIREAHRIAVKADPAALNAFRGHVFRSLFLEAQVLTRSDG